MFKLKILLILLFCSSFKLNSINFRQILAFSNTFCTGNTLESSINKIKSQIRRIDFNSNQVDDKVVELEDNISGVLIQKYSENQKITEKEGKLITGLQESEEMNLFKKHWCKIVDFESGEKIPAAPQLQTLFTEAKKIMDIDDNNPIYKNIKHPKANGYANILGEIFISDYLLPRNENFWPFCYGDARIVILHELVHKKRNHGIMEVLLSLCYKLNSSQLNKVRRINETEADTTALEVGNCYKCSEEYSYSSGDNDLERLEKGYLTKSQILEIAKKQKEQNFLCEYHKNNQ